MNIIQISRKLARELIDFLSDVSFEDEPSQPVFEFLLEDLVNALDWAQGEAGDSSARTETIEIQITGGTL